MPARTYDDEALRRAVQDSNSWRGVLRELGLRGTSAAAARSVKSHVSRLGLDTSHFTRGRRWTDEALLGAVSESASWQQVADRLGLVGGSSIPALKGHTLRLGVSTGHLDRAASAHLPATSMPRPDIANLPRAGSMMAASWFTLCGYAVTWPLEPCRYDLLVNRNSEFLRVQVKTSWKKRGNTWVVSLTSTGHPTGGSSRYQVYGPDEIDHFFVIDGELNYYLLPLAVVGGLTGISLSAYAGYRVGCGTGISQPQTSQPT